MAEAAISKTGQIDMSDERIITARRRRPNHARPRKPRRDFEYQYVPSYGPGRIEWGNPFHVCQGRENLDNFALADGFADWAEMKTFWQKEHGMLPFSGMLIKWEPIQ